MGARAFLVACLRLSRSVEHSHIIAIVVRPPSLKSFANQETCQIQKWSCWKTCELIFQHGYSAISHDFWVIMWSAKDFSAWTLAFSGWGQFFQSICRSTCAYVISLVASHKQTNTWCKYVIIFLLHSTWLNRFSTVITWVLPWPRRQYHLICNGQMVWMYWPG